MDMPELLKRWIIAVTIDRPISPDISEPLKSWVVPMEVNRSVPVDMAETLKTGIPAPKLLAVSQDLWGITERQAYTYRQADR